MEILEFTDDLIIAATQKSKEMGTLNNSITGGEGNIAGFIGEYAAKFIYGGDIVNTYDYDLVLADGRRADVKTKRTTVEPKPHYECSIAAYNTKQDCDMYIFTRVDMDKKLIYVLGHYDKKKYFQDSRLLKKGEIDGDNGFIVKSNCYNIMISQLEQCDHGEMVALTIWQRNKLI